MKTQLELARDGTITKEMKVVANAENVDIEILRSRILDGSVVIMSRGNISIGIGLGLSTKVNVNIGTSSIKTSLDDETRKARIAEMYGADTITDLSMGGDIRDIRRNIMENTSLPLTTVPIYQIAAEKGLLNMDRKDIIKNMERQAEEGVSSFVLHCTDRKMLGMVRTGKRIMGVVSKGGSITCAYMMMNDCENPFVSNFEQVLKILKRHDVVLSLGNTMRSGCIHDARDRAQVEEIKQNVRLAKMAHEAGVQVIIEGTGGHVRPGNIARYIKYQKKQSNFPLFVAGPLPTDIAVGHDHIAGSIGASIASGAGADYLCYITPSEHLGLPGPEQVREGLIAFKIAAHIGDSIKYGPDGRDRNLALRRAELDWEGQMKYAIDSERARELSPKEGPCTMCGDFCAIKIMKSIHATAKNAKDAKNG